jgi:hypothetical protein
VAGFELVVAERKNIGDRLPAGLGPIALKKLNDR